MERMRVGVGVEQRCSFAGSFPKCLEITRDGPGQRWVSETPMWAHGPKYLICCLSGCILAESWIGSGGAEPGLNSKHSLAKGMQAS